MTSDPRVPPSAAAREAARLVVTAWLRSEIGPGWNLAEPPADAERHRLIEHATAALESFAALRVAEARREGERMCVDDPMASPRDAAQADAVIDGLIESAHVRYCRCAGFTDDPDCAAFRTALSRVRTPGPADADARLCYLHRGTRGGCAACEMTERFRVYIRAAVVAYEKIGTVGAAAELARAMTVLRNVSFPAPAAAPEPPSEAATPSNNSLRSDLRAVLAPLRALAAALKDGCWLCREAEPDYWETMPRVVHTSEGRTWRHYARRKGAGQEYQVCELSPKAHAALALAEPALLALLGPEEA